MNRTQAQSEASRLNGSKSHGPVTPEGKARSAANATRHGLYSRVVVLNNEDPAAFEALLVKLNNHYRPADPDEEGLVQDLAACYWRLNRLLTLEVATIDTEVDLQRAKIDAGAHEVDEAVRTSFAMSTLTRESGSLKYFSAHEGRLRRAIRYARAELQKRKNKPEFPAHVSPDPDAQTVRSAPQPPQQEIVNSNPAADNVARSAERPETAGAKPAGQSAMPSRPHQKIAQSNPAACPLEPRAVHSDLDSTPRPDTAAPHHPHGLRPVHSDPLRPHRLE